MGTFAPGEVAHRRAQLRIRNPVIGEGLHRAKAALDLVFPLRTRVETADALGDAEFDSPVVTGFEVQAVVLSQAAPVANHLTEKPAWENPAQKFAESGLHTVLVQEYSKKFPHQKYALGLTGRPSGTGPGIYINSRDNSKLHGPGGYAKDGLGDPCFAKVVKGFDVADRLFDAAGKLNPGEWKELKGGPIAVRSMKLLNVKK